MDSYLIPPRGWRFAAYPWHAMAETRDLPELIQVGRVLLPEFFHLVIGKESMWNDRMYDRGDLALFIDFQIYNWGDGDGEELEIVTATSSYEELPVAIETVRKFAPLVRWKQLGVHYMTQYLARFEEEGERPNEDPSPFGVQPTDAYYERPPRNAQEWVMKLQERSIAAYAEARNEPPPRRKRNKITDDFLKEVAVIYKAADKLGMPPTRDVATHFRAPHSTAAKWVGTARRKGFLPPID